MFSAHLLKILGNIHHQKQLIPALLILSIFISCSGWEEGQWGKPPLLEVFEVTKRDHQLKKSYVAKIEGLREVKVRSNVRGFVAKILVNEGDFVTKNQALIELEDKQALHIFKSREAAVKEAELNTLNAELDVQKLKGLVKDSVESPVKLQKAKTTLAALKARLKVAQSSYNEAKSLFNYRIIKAPVNGYVGRMVSTVGDLVSPSDPLPLTTISNTEKIVAYASLSEQEYLSLINTKYGNTINKKLKMLPKVSLEMGHNNIILKGAFNGSSGKINPLTGSILLRAQFNTPNNNVLSGSQGKLIVKRSLKNKLTVPTMSAFITNGKIFVYVMGADSVVHQREIKIDNQIDNMYLLKEGVIEGEIVLGTGIHRVHSGMKIVPIKTEAESLVQSSKAEFK